MENKSNCVDTFIKFILAGKAASHQLQLFTSKPKSKLKLSAALCSFTSHSTTALYREKIYKSGFYFSHFLTEDGCNGGAAVTVQLVALFLATFAAVMFTRV